MSDRQTLSLKQEQDVKILQKINRVHRDLFPEKYPGQVDHCLRLIMERLQTGLEKPSDIVLSNPDTWPIDTEEISNLARAAHSLNEIRRNFS